MSNNSLLVAKDRIRVNYFLPYPLSNSLNKRSTTDVYLLPPASIYNASTIVERIKEGDGYIKEVVIKGRRKKKYLLVNRHTEKNGNKMINMEDMLISASTIRRLLIEALHLIEQLHKGGFKLNFPLQQLLQLEHGIGGE